MNGAASGGGECKEMYGAASDGGECKEMFDAASDGGECKEMAYDDELPEDLEKWRCLNYYGVSTKVSIRPFAHERFMDCVLAYQNLDISRWNILSSAAEKLRVVEGKEENQGDESLAGDKLAVVEEKEEKRGDESLAGDKLAVVEEKEEKQGDESIVYQLEALNDDADSDVMVSKAMDELLGCYNRERLTKQDVDKFKRQIEKARQEFGLIEYLERADFIQHDSSVETVIESVPKDIIDSIVYSDVKAFVERYIWTLKDWEATRLYYDFMYFLPKCCWITSNTCVFRDLKKLTEDATFLERRFHMIRDEKVSTGFRIYVAALCMNQAVKTVEERKYDYINRIEKEFEHVRLSFEKRRKKFPAHFTEPIHFLVFKECEEKYTIQDPVVEIAKIRAVFRGIPLDYYEKNDMYHKAEYAARIAAISTLQGRGSGIRRMETKRQKISGDAS